MTAKRSDLDAILSSLVDLDDKQKSNAFLRRTLKLRKQVAIQDDTLLQQRKRRDRVEQRRQKSILFSKSQELALLERLCRKVAGTLCDTSWNKLFVTDPDVVLASKPIKPHRRDARARVAQTRKTQKNIKSFAYSSFPQPDALVGLKSAHTKLARKVTQDDMDKAETAVTQCEENLSNAQRAVDAAVEALSVRRLNTAERKRRLDDVKELRAAASVANNAYEAAIATMEELQEIWETQNSHEERGGDAAEGDETKAGMYASLTTPLPQGDRPANWKKMRVGQLLAKDERWPAWLAPKPELETSANPEMLSDDQLYFDQFGAYLSETMLAAMDDVVSEIRVQATLSRQIRRIPIRRLVAEPLVSNWFAKWIASVILKNRALVGKTWHKDVIIDNIAKQLDECRAFFYDPQKYGAGERIYDEMPPPPADDVDEEDEDDDGDKPLVVRIGYSDDDDDEDEDEED